LTATVKTESVWDYPRPPRLEPTSRRIRVLQAGIAIADSTNALRVLETSHPPVYYIPPQDIAMRYLSELPLKSSYCEFKGRATYWNVDVTGIATESNTPGRSEAAAWSYPQPNRAFAALKDHLAFYASRISDCWVDDELVVPQPGDFYGGWITRDLLGPFKGTPGTQGW
jgi:uncharacterized protein (DUF427 family)